MKDSNIPSGAESAELEPVREADTNGNSSAGGAKCATTGGRSIDSDRSNDPMELALAHALEGATAAGEWTTVAQLARELEARRTARVGVVSLEAERKRRGDRS